MQGTPNKIRAIALGLLCLYLLAKLVGAAAPLMPFRDVNSQQRPFSAVVLFLASSAASIVVFFFGLKCGLKGVRLYYIGNVDQARPNMNIAAAAVATEQCLINFWRAFIEPNAQDLLVVALFWLGILAWNIYRFRSRLRLLSMVA